MLHYVAVLVPQPEGIWRVHFPDFPGCRAEGAHLEQAIGAARQAVYQRLDTAAANGAVPSPRSVDAIIADPDWIRARGIDWRRAVISLVPFADVANSIVVGQHVHHPRSAAQ
jgi:predicted RNase H-like HicB family nuclease